MIKPISYSQFCKKNKIKPNTISLTLYSIYSDGFMDCLEQVTIPNFNKKALEHLLYKMIINKLTMVQMVKEIEKLIYRR